MNKIEINRMPKLPFAMEEAINRLRINISFLGTDIKKIMLVSTFPNEGKSFVTMQLWRQMVETGIDSVLVDADLRKSIMVDKYDIKREDGKDMMGISHYLASEDALEDVVLKTKWEHGDILPNVDNLVNPSMLLESERFKNMLDELAQNYRYVFVDAPPLDIVSDGEKIGSMCDGAILVIRAGETSKSAIKNSIRQLERSGCKVLGVILNRVDGSKSGYYRKKHGKYYMNEYYSAKNDK